MAGERKIQCSLMQKFVGQRMSTKFGYRFLLGQNTYCQVIQLLNRIL